MTTIVNMDIKPLRDGIVVKVLDKIEKTTQGGLIVQEDHRRKRYQVGEVLAVGLGAIMEDGKRRPMGVNVGEKIMFHKLSATEVKAEGSKLYMIKEADVLAIMEDD